MFRLLVAGLLSVCWATAAPNVLFLFADDQRPDTISAWGNPHIKTPTLDRLVAEGFSFRRAYCMGSDNGAVCVPSRAMLATGKAYTRLTPDIAGHRTLGQILGESGYTTFATGKWHNQRPSWLRSFQRGKTMYFGGMSDHTNVLIEELGPDGKLRSAGFSRRFSSALFADSVIEFLESYDEDGTLLRLRRLHRAPRSPAAARRPIARCTTARATAAAARTFLPQHPFDNGHMTGRDEELGPWPRTIPVVGDQLAEYYGMITHLDDQVGRILAALERSRQSRRHLRFLCRRPRPGARQPRPARQAKRLRALHGDALDRQRSRRAARPLERRLSLTCSTCSRRSCGSPGVEPRRRHRRPRLCNPIWKGEKSDVRETLFLGFKRHHEGGARPIAGSSSAIRKVDVTQLFDLAADPA